MSKTFKKLGKSKLARGLLAAAAVYFLGSWLGGGDTSAADAGGDGSPQSWSEGDAIDRGSDQLLDQSADPNLIAEPPETPIPQPAPVTPPAPTAAPTTPTAAQAASNAFGPKDTIGTGIIGKWFKDLSPAGQSMVMASATGGAAGLMNAIAQKNAMEDQKEREDKAREDKMRRTAIAAYAPGSFRPKGILATRMG